jgi:YVTN family beta-propeller protein
LIISTERMKTSRAWLQLLSGGCYPLTTTAVAIALTSSIFAKNPVVKAAVSGLPQNNVVATIPVTNASGPMVFSPNGDLLYVAGQSANIILVISTSSNAVSSTFSTSYPSGLAVSSDGTTLYSSDWQSGAVAVLNASTGALNTTIDIAGAEGLALTPNGEELYVTGGSGLKGTVSPVNTATNKVKGKPINVPGYPYWILFTPNGKDSYVVNGAGIGYLNEVGVATRTVLSLGGGLMDEPQRHRDQPEWRYPLCDGYQ